MGRMLTAAAYLIAALALAYLLLLQPHESGAPVDLPQDTPPAEAPTGDEAGSTTVPGGGALRVTPRADVVPFGDDPAAPVPGAPVIGRRGVRAQARVQVALPPGWSGLEGELYALPAGHTGLDDLERVPHAEWEASDGTSRVLNLPHAGPWDILLRCPHATASRGAVRIPPGEAVDVELRWPPLASLPLRLDPEVPESLRGGHVRLVVRSAHDDDELAYPGIGARAPVEFTLRLEPGRTGRSPAIPTGHRYDLDATFRRADGTHASAHTPQGQGRFSILPTRVAHGGDAHAVGVVHAARLELEARIAPDQLRPWGGWRPTLTYRITDAFGVPWVDDDQLRVDHEQVWQEAISLPPGPATITWSGQGIRPGALTTEALRAGTTKRLQLPLVFETARPPPPPPQARMRRVRIAGAPDTRVTVSAMLTTDAGHRTAWDGEFDIEGGVIELRRAYAEATVISAHHGMTHASWPVRLDRQQPPPLRMVPAGHVLLAPQVLVDAELGGLWIRRKDGGPMLTSQISGEELKVGEVDRVLRVEPGVIVGPLPEGEHTFELHLGLRRLPDVAARVSAGRIEVLPIDW